MFATFRFQFVPMHVLLYFWLVFRSGLDSSHIQFRVSNFPEILERTCAESAPLGNPSMADTAFAAAAIAASDGISGQRIFVDGGFSSLAVAAPP